MKRVHTDHQRIRTHVFHVVPTPRPSDPIFYFMCWGWLRHTPLGDDMVIAMAMRKRKYLKIENSNWLVIDNQYEYSEYDRTANHRTPRIWYTFRNCSLARVLEKALNERHFSVFVRLMTWTELDSCEGGLVLISSFAHVSTLYLLEETERGKGSVECRG